MQLQRITNDSAYIVDDLKNSKQLEKHVHELRDKSKKLGWLLVCYNGALTCEKQKKELAKPLSG